jgi:Tol biopolymer transport system component
MKRISTSIRAVFGAILVMLALAAARDVSNIFKLTGAGCPSTSPDLFFVSGMELGTPGSSFGGFFDATSGGISADSSVVRNGTYSLKAVTGGGPSAAEKNAPTGQGVMVAHFAIRLASLPSGSPHLFTFTPFGGNGAALAYNSATGKFAMRWGTATPLVDSNVTPVAGTWYVVDMRATFNSNPRTVDLQIDGVTQPGISSAEATNTARKVVFGTNLLGFTFTANYDDMMASTTSADYPMPDGVVSKLLPDGMGTNVNPADFQNDDGSAIAASSYTRVDDPTMQGIVDDYVKQVTDGSTSYLEFTFGNTGASCVFGASAIADIGKLASQTSDVKVKVDDSGTPRTIFTGDPTCTNCLLPQTLVLPSASANQTSVNALKLQFGFSANASPSPIMDSAMLEIATVPDDTTPPAQPTFTGTTPTSPGNNNSPKILGAAEAGSTVNLYTNSTCTSAVAGSGTAATFGMPGLGVSVVDNSSTTYWATATDGAGNVSACSSTSIPYVEDSTAPGAPTITVAPSPDPGTNRNPGWSFTGEAGATFQCELRRGGTVVLAFGACTSAKSYDLTSQPYGTYTFAVKQADAAGNGGAEATENYRLVAAGGRVAFGGNAPGNFEIYTMDPDGSNQTRLTTSTGRADVEPTWSPDGSKIYWTAQVASSYDLWVMNSDGTGQTQLTSDALNERFPDVSPNGTKIVFQNYGCPCQIYVSNVDGTGRVQLTSSGSNRLPKWSPDGSKITFTSDRASNKEDIYTMNADGSAQTRITFDQKDFGSYWSPDGTKMVMFSDRTGWTNLYSMNADGTGQVQLTSLSGEFADVGAWYPSSQIYWTNVSLSPANQDIWSMNSDGTGKTRLTTTSTVYEFAPDPSPLDLYAAAPTFTATAPVSPANNNSPKILGTAESGSTVDLFTDSACTSAVAASGTAASFASPGLTVSVGDNNSTTFWGKVRDPSENVSTCSPTSITYVEDSAVPGVPTITVAPSPDPGSNRSPIWTFTGEAGAAFQCELRRGGTVVSAFVACTSPKSYDLSSQPYATYTFAVRQSDSAGNGPGPEATEDYRLVAGGSKIAFSSFRDGSYDIYTMDSDGSNVAQLTAEAGTISNNEPAWSAGGDRIAWSRYDTAATDYDIWKMNADGASKTRLTNTASADERYPDWSPDNSKIAFNTDSSSNDDIYTINSDGSGLTRLTVAAGNDRYADWSPDGSKITFLSARDGNNEIYVMNADGSAQTRLTTNAAIDMSPVWSPDGTKIAFASDRDGDYEVFTMNPDGTGLSQITSNTTLDNFLSWGLGDRISFIAIRDGDEEIFVMNPDGSGQTQLTTNTTSDQNPDNQGTDVFAAPPTFTTTAPPSPGNNNSPKIVGTAESGSTVELFTNSTCTSSIAASGTASAFASPGLTVSVANDTSTTFWGKVTDASLNVSACSPTSTTYVEDSTPPGAPTVTAAPSPDPGFRTGVSWSFTGEAGATFECELSKGGTIISAFGACTSPKSYTLGGGDGTYTFKVRQKDAAGNGPSSSVSEDYTLNSTLGKIVYSSPADGDYEVYTMNADGSGATQLTFNAGGLVDVSPGWSPDKNQVVWAQGSGAVTEIYKMNADGSAQTRVTSNGVEDNFPDWSPDGSKIAVMRGGLGTQDIYTYNPDGTGSVQLTNATNNDTMPDWSPSGAKIVFSSARDGNPEIYSMNADGSTQTRLTSNASTDQWPVWSPDGSKIAFTSDRDGNFEIYVMNADGTGQTRLTTAAASDIEPAWSPDGTQIGFISARDGNGEFYAMNTDGTSQTRVTNTASNEDAPDWATFASSDATPPSPPSFAATNPASPANNNSPSVAGAAEAGSTVNLYTNSACTSAIAASGTAASFASPGLGVSLADNSSTTFYGTATDAANNTSACSSTSITYIEDSSAPVAPTLSSTNPVSQSNNNTPLILGTAEAGSTVKLYTDSTCTSAVNGTGTAATFASPGVAASVSDNSLTMFFATATDAAGNTSLCSSSSISYVEDSAAPAQPTLSSTNPTSPANNNSPKVLGSAEAGSTVKLYADSSCLSAVAATGTAAAFNSPGLTVSVTDNTSTTFYATATDAANNTSACSSSSISYVEDSAAPAQPTLSSTNPASPANNNSPKILGSTEAGSTVKLYTDSSCSSAVAAAGTAAAFNSPGLTVGVTDNTSTTFYATATDAANNTSGCSSSSVTYLEDSAGPGAPSVSSSNPASPANNNSPLILGSADAGSTVKLYTNATCTSGVAATGTAAAFSSPGLSVSVADNSSTTLYATATDAANNPSPCSSTSVTYVEDSAPPARPTFSSTSPSPPANNNSPSILGDAETGSTVRLYTNSACSSAVAATGTAAAFSSPGLVVTVADNSTATFHATATDTLGNTSACSTSSISYVEDSAPPAAPTITATPADPGTDETPTWSFTGDGSSTLQCELSRGGTVIYAFGSCGSPKTYTLTSQAEGTFTFLVRQTDQAGNVGPTASDNYTLDRVDTIAFSSDRDGNFEVFVMGEDGSGQTQITTTSSPTNNVDVSWSPDASKIAFARKATQGDIWVMNADGSGQTRLTTSLEEERYPDFSPDGSKIVYDRGASGSQELWTMNADGTGQAQLTNTAGFNAAAKWSPDGSKLALISTRDGNQEIYTMNSDGTGATRLTVNAATDQFPHWSADGSKLAYMTNRDGNQEIYTMNTDGSGLTRLTNNASADQVPSWGPNSKIVFDSLRTGNGDIYAMGADGSAQTRLTSVAAEDTEADWATGVIGAPAAPSLVSTSPGSPANNNSPLILGFAEAGSTVKLYTDSACTSAIAATGGAAAFNSPGLPVSVSDNSTTTFYATATNGAGNSSPCSTSSITYVEDSSPPAQPTLATTDPTSPANDNAPVVFGSADVGTTVTLYTDSSCSAAVAGSGSSAEFSSPGLPVSVGDDSTTSFYAKTTDAANNFSACSTSSITYVEDSTAPAPPTITTAPPDPGSDTTPTWIFSGEPGGTFSCELTRGGSTIFAVDDCTSPHTYDITLQLDGTYRFSVTQTDAAGNTGAAATDDYTLDRSGPAAPTFTGTNPASPANNNSPLVAGSAEAGSTVRLYTNSTCSSAVAATGTAATFASPGLSVSVTDNSTTSFYATATDGLGNTSSCSLASIGYTEDSAAPAQPTLTSTAPTSPANNNSPRILGSAEAGSTVKLFTDAACTSPEAASGTAAAFGSPGLTATVADNSTTAFHATATDAAGNTSACSTSSITYVEDSTTGPAAPVIDVAPTDPTKDSTPTWEFTGDAGVTFECQLMKDTTTIYALGPCTAPITYDLTLPGSDGTYTFSVRAMLLGVPSGFTPDTFTLDTTSPGPPSITATPADPGRDKTPTWSFTGEPGASFECELSQAGVVITAFGSCTSSHTYDLNGKPDGSYTFSVQQTDAAGNGPGPVAADDYSLDTADPAPPTATVVPADPGSDETPTWDFTGEAGATFDCELKQGTSVIFAAAPCSGPHTFDMSSLPDGTYTFLVTQTDAAGNTGTPFTDDYTLDTTGPSVSVTVTPPATANDPTPTWEFSGEPGSTFECQVSRGTTTLVGFTTCTTPFSHDLSGQPDGTYTFEIRATDPLGNTGPAASFDYILDRAPPAASTIESGPGSTGNDETPTWGFSGEAGSTFECEITRGGSVISVLAPCTSPATFDLTSQPDGTYTLTVVQTDAAGNPGPATTVDYLLDTDAPPVPTITSTPASPGTDATPVWNFSGDPGSTFECRLTQSSTVIAGFAPCTSTVTFDLSGQPDGTFVVEIRQVDPAGNAGPVVTDTYVYDAPPMPPIFVSLPPTTASDETPTFGFVGEPGTTFQCQLSEDGTVIAGFASCSSPKTFDLSNLPDGTYTVTVRAIDGLGRAGAESTTLYTLDRSRPKQSAGAASGGGDAGETSAPGEGGEESIPAAPTKPGDKSKTGQGEATGVKENYAKRLFTAVARALRFPLLLLLLVVLFLVIQNRIDRSDPKLALAPVFEQHVSFMPPPA